MWKPEGVGSRDTWLWNNGAVTRASNKKNKNANYGEKKRVKNQEHYMYIKILK